MMKIMLAALTGLLVGCALGLPCGAQGSEAGLAAIGAPQLAASGGTPDTAVTKPPAKIYDPGCPRCGRHARPRVGGCGGPVPGYVFANLGVINKQVRTMGIPALDEDIFIVGGKGYARVGNIILGGGGYGGSSETSGMPDQSARFAKVDFGYGGGLIGADLAYSRYDLIAGLLVGSGGVTITRRIASQGVFNWDDSWSTFGKDLPDSVATSDLTVASRITANFIAIEPFLEIKIWVTRFMALDLSGSYLRAHIRKGTWKMEGLDILDSPEANLGGPTAKLGLTFGT
ncbi:MAG TPA: hypothetical protein VMU02_06070 [bacterium]|nr:hypothetical protein [bacterium]